MHKEPKTLTETSNYFLDIRAIDCGRLSSLFFTSQLFMHTAKEVQGRQCANFQERLYVNNVSIFNTGMAFELLYKIFGLLDNQEIEKVHRFEKLNKALKPATKAVLRGYIEKAGWQSEKDFLRYLDVSIRHGDRRYYDQHSGFDSFWSAEDHHCLPGLASLYDKMLGEAAKRIWINPNLPFE